MEEAILNFHKQFAWEPVVVNAGGLKRHRRFVVGGMGGSSLATGLLVNWMPEINVIVHRDYGLPVLSDAKERLYIASSYSGNTEETIDFAKSALKKGYKVATISIGGKLLKFAEKNNLPHIIIPDTKIQPRSALGFSMLAIAKLIGAEHVLRELHRLSTILKPEALCAAGKKLSRILFGKVPIICASTRNRGVAYNWKIKMNETGKIPAFYNVFPELNHNEMTGFDTIETTKKLSHGFHFVFLTDSVDHPKVQRRMAVCKKLYEDRGLSVTEVPFKGDTTLERIFSSLLIADWTALYLSNVYGTEAEQVPMVEQFKKLITVTGN